MSFYGVVIAFTVLLCMLEINAAISYAACLNSINIQYAEAAHAFASMINNFGRQGP